MRLALHRSFVLCSFMAAVAFGQQPLEYFLDLRIDPARPEFSGTVKIDVRLATSTDSILLHALDLKITSARVGDHAATVETLADDEQIRLKLATPIPAGRSQIVLEFTGALSDKLQQGLYRRKSGDDWYAFTTFTAIEARRAFPCFDEPRFKTPWNVNLEIPEKLVAAANAPMVNERVSTPGWKRVRFARTAVLPSEVVAFTVGPWEVFEGPRVGSRKVPSRILKIKGGEGDPQAALAATPEILARLEAYVGMPYPWAKLDQVALLANAFGAVENPGLITYRPELLLAKPDRISAMRSVMAHELTHQWFGNLVTQQSWQDVWLSEGFASWLGGKIADLDLPESERGLRAVATRNTMLERDASDKARAVRVAKLRRDEMKDIYGREVYGKAASILLMLESWLGEEAFQRAVRRYLREHAGGHASMTDFAKALAAESERKEVPQVLATFLNQVGVPRVTVKLNCTNDKPRVEVETAIGWQTPVCVRTPAGRACVVTAGQGSAELKDTGCPLWLVPNADGTGYFRAEFDRKLIEYAPLTEREKRALTPTVTAPR